MELPYDLKIPLLDDVDLKEIKSLSCSPWHYLQEPRHVDTPCPSVNGRTHSENEGCVSLHRIRGGISVSLQKRETLPFATWTDLEGSDVR